MISQEQIIEQLQRTVSESKPSIGGPMTLQTITTSNEDATLNGSYSIPIRLTGIGVGGDDSRSISGLYETTSTIPIPHMMRDVSGPLINVSNDYASRANAQLRNFDTVSYQRTTGAITTPVESLTPPHI